MMSGNPSFTLLDSHVSVRVQVRGSGSMFEGSGDLIALERIRLSNRASLESSDVERQTEHEHIEH